MSYASALALAVGLLTSTVWGQSPPPYPNAATDTGIHTKTPTAAPPVNLLFNDPDFGSPMVRVTDEFSNPAGTTTYQAATAGHDEWSLDGSKFYVNTGGGSVLAYGFDPTTMAISTLGGMPAGQGFRVPLRPNASFSRVDSDELYGTTNAAPLSISAYRFSTDTTSTVVDTTACGTVPALVPGPGVRSDDDVNVSDSDQRISISEGGNQYSRHMFAIVYDKNLGCRWYNTQTGEVGGQWGAAGTASTPDRYLIRHAYLSHSGRYLRIALNFGGFYVWDIATLQVTKCPIPGPLNCNGYSASGYNYMAGRSSNIDDWNIVKRSLDNLADITPLVWPLTSGLWGQEKHFTWNNNNPEDNAPLCGTAFVYYSNDAINRPYDGEVFCVATDGLNSVIWRFAHHRSSTDEDEFNTEPTVSISRDGRFLLFNSNWDEQLGTQASGVPRADMWIVKLD